MARIIQFDQNNGNILKDLPSANTGLYVDDQGNALPGYLINPDTSSLDGVVAKEFWIVDLNLLVVREMTQPEKDAVILEQQAQQARFNALQRVERGRDIIAELEAEMVRVGLNDDMKAKLIGGIHDVLILLTAGQLGKAKEVVLNLQPSGDLTQNMINKLQDFMNREVL